MIIISDSTTILPVSCRFCNTQSNLFYHPAPTHHRHPVRLPRLKAEHTPQPVHHRIWTLEHLFLSFAELLRTHCTNNTVLFKIHNKSVIPQDVQSRIFRKSFSTKSRDRGLGTYSIKLFTEKYLKGKVWFTSDKDIGTTFYIQVPCGS